MKNFNIAAIFLFCISFTLNAQTSPEDTTVYKISREKADSLLISLSKGKANNANVKHEEVSSQTDTVSLKASSVKTDTASLKVNSTKTDTVSLKVNNAKTDTLETKRKKADVNRRELLIRQSREIALKDDGSIDYSDLCSINEGTMIGMGGYKMKDQYLSQEKYGGLGFRFMNERMRIMKLSNNRVSRQNIVNVDISSAINGAENANFLSAFADYSVGYHYRFFPDPYFKILMGGSIRGMLGMVYNTRNGNNPMTIHADVDLNFSLIAIYEFRIKNNHLTLRYQFESPFMGVLFSPVYDQSYYEIFSLGNTAEVLNINSFHNKFAMRNYLTLDFPIGNATVRTGYFGSFYSTNVHEIDRYIISNNFMLGFVKEFVAFGGREMKRRNLFHSAYY